MGIQNWYIQRFIRWLLTSQHQKTGFKGVFFETKGVTCESSKREFFSFVVLKSPALARISRPDPDSFAEHFARARRASPGLPPVAITFENLGRDALLISPMPLAERREYSGYFGSGRSPEYAHFPFLTSAPAPDVSELLRLMAASYLNRLITRGTRNVWLNTSGLGVSWLHVRLDSSPKYYQYRPFARIGSTKRTGYSSRSSTQSNYYYDPSYQYF
mmetsp:Transcript_16336/g.23719  ORF Transcript_16336/g.23719 Transcript_16336/m.23719 type:complete len:216 (-) Transcript_16336:5155-5802(-)